MKSDEIKGYWILKSREDSPKQDVSFSIFDRVYTIEKSEVEIIAFNPNNNCYQLGINTVPEEEEVEDERIFDLVSFLPGKYNLTNSSIQILDSGKMKIVDRELHIIVAEPDYYCKEVWIRLPQEFDDLKRFIDKEIGHLD